METLTKLGHPEKSRAKRIGVTFNFERAESFPYGVGLIEIGGWEKRIKKEGTF